MTKKKNTGRIRSIMLFFVFFALSAMLVLVVFQIYLSSTYAFLHVKDPDYFTPIILKLPLAVLQC